MTDPTFVVSTLLAVVAIALTYLAVPRERLPRWVALRWGRWARTARTPVGPPVQASGAACDVFVSHTRAGTDVAERVKALVEESGLGVHRVGPGDVIAVAADRSLRTTVVGVLVFDPSAPRDRRLLDEYAAVLDRVYDDERRRLIPVLVGEVDRADLPVFARIRQSVDLRGETDTEVERRLLQLAQQVRRIVMGSLGEPPADS